MKPLRLELEAFGSYPGRVEIDFAPLAARGLFVVTGPTGSGKTTIFDAMCFALYGKMPLKDGGEVRSHHAGSDRPTSVVFHFALDADAYVVERRPEFERPAKRGGGTVKESARATLTRLRDDGSSEAVATGVTNVTQMVENLLGLAREQFQRVMLLPQGEVARFLLDDSKDREDLLATLFGGEVYDRVVERLAEAERHLAEQIAELDENARHLERTASTALSELEALLDAQSPDAEETTGTPTRAIGDAETTDTDDTTTDVEGLHRRLEASLPLRTVLDDEARQARTLAATAAEAHTTTQATLRRIEDLDATTKALDELALTRPSVEAEEIRATASRRARPAVEAEDAVAIAHGEWERAQATLAARLEDLSRQALAHGITIDVTSTVTISRDLHRWGAELDGQRRLLEGFDAAVAAQKVASTQHENLTVAEREANSRVTDLESRLGILHARREELLAAPRDLEGAQARVQQLAEALGERDRLDDLHTRHRTLRDELDLAEAEERRMWSRFVATQAPRLAASLRPEEPCPVCGALDHPEPARADEDESVTFDQVEGARDTTEGHRRRTTEVENQIAGIVAALGVLATLTVDEIAHQHEQAQIAAEAVAVAVSELAATDQDLETTDAELRRAHNDQAGLKARLDAANSDLDEATQATETARAACADLDRETVEMALGAHGELTARTEDLAQAFDTVTSSSERLAARRDAAAEALGLSGFASADGARAASMDPAVEQAAIDAAERLRTRQGELEARRRTLEDQGIPEVRPDLEESQHRAETARRLSEELDAASTRAQDRHDAARRALEAHEVLTRGTAEIRESHSRARRAHQVCRGTNGSGLSLRRWVLAQELERVVAVASVHLGQMSAGRYSMRRLAHRRDARRNAGLDLEILDAHTGRARSPRSLSGGEQFQASLALALGLADVVSLGGTGSGRRFEALFVDEGFGALDPVALDDAIDTLHQLQATGRMVGAITHVEAMKERLHVGIEVRRLEDGRGSTLVVHP